MTSPLRRRRPAACLLGSRLEELFALQCRAAGLTPTRELEGAIPGRRYRCDFAFPDDRLIIEIDGGTWSAKGAHGSGAGANRDREKANLLVLQGWRVLRFTGDHVRSGQALSWTLQALGRPDAIPRTRMTVARRTAADPTLRSPDRTDAPTGRPA